MGIFFNYNNNICILGPITDCLITFSIYLVGVYGLTRDGTDSVENVGSFQIPFNMKYK